MSVEGYEIRVSATVWTFRPSDFQKFTEKAAALAAAGLYLRTDTVQLPGECDAQRADRLAMELGRAEVEIRKLKRAAKATKRSKPAVARAKSK